MFIIIFQFEKRCDFWNFYEKNMKYKCYEHIPYTICSAVQRGYGREPSDMSPHKATSRIFEILFIFISHSILS